MDKRLKAALWMGGAIVSFTLMAVGGRETKDLLSIWQLLSMRTFVGLLLISLILTVVGWHHARPRSPRVMTLFAARNLAHFGATFCWFTGVSLLPLAQVFALEFTTPIWVAILAALVLKERLTRYRLLAVTLGFIGVLIVVRPGLDVFQPTSFVVLTAALGFAVSVIITKVALRDVTVFGFIFWMMVMQLPMGILATTLGGGWVMPPAEAWVWIFVIGCAGLAAHFSLASALSYADATFVTPIDFLRLPTIAVVGVLLYGEQIELAVFLGGALIMSGVVATLMERRTAL